MAVASALGGNYEPVAADFDGDGRTDVFLYAPGAAQDDVAYANSTPGSFTKVPMSVYGDYRPFVGDFNGDGRADIFWYAPGSAASSIWFGQANRAFARRTLTIRGDWQPVAGDFNCDGRADIVWYSPSGGHSYIWTATGSVRWRWAGIAIPAHAILRAADFNGDGCSDLLVYTPGPGTDELLLGEPFGGFKPKAINQPGYFEPIVGNFEGTSTFYAGGVFWYAPGTPIDQAWYSRFGYEPFTFTDAGGYVNGNYRPVAGDFNGDGQTDILWLNPASTHSTIWFDVRRDLTGTDGVRWVRETTDEEIFNAAASATDGSIYTVAGLNGMTGDTRPANPEVITILVKYSAGGTELWHRQVTDTGAASAFGVAVDSNGNAYVVGTTAGHITGSPETTPGTFIAEYASDGTRGWVHQTSDVEPIAIAVSPAGDSYVVGEHTNRGTTDGFLAAYDPSGALRWRHDSLPGLYYRGGGVAVDREGGPIIATGPIVARYTAGGTLEWGRWLGTGTYGATSVAVDQSDHIVIAGNTDQPLAGAPEHFDGRDPFLAQYDATGQQTWVHLFSTGPTDTLATGVALNSFGDAFMVGSTNSVVPGAIEGSSGDYDPWLAKFDSSGAHVRSRQLGSPGFDIGSAVTATPSGHVVFVGAAGGTMPLQTTSFPPPPPDSSLYAFVAEY